MKFSQVYGSTENKIMVEYFIVHVKYRSKYRVKYRRSCKVPNHGKDFIYPWLKLLNEHHVG